ncbi:COQ9 family protein [Defluviimonas sp. WL0050]|uniref:COQ9 family protein n=1 Tax=Albidovulum litorale TaxID=2984134 RepID=A0ABT2ZTT7_9RHOB|nr:COQ9 family protein [Defluviimonas sp. WL0050]MCV2874156.1 COQ9 family protein [Defluviimonas sp. WL0050]
MENKGFDIGSAKERLMEAALSHAVFDGWSEATFRAACEDIGIAPALARAVFPRGALDLAIAYHKAGDAAMVAALDAEDLTALRFRDRVALAVRLRLEGADRELVRRGAALFALPQNAATGASLVWGTADAIWRALGDTSEDINWYSKRATLSAVYSSVVLYWLGDDSAGQDATWQFLDRRIEDVMRFEKFKAQVRDNPVLGRVLAGPMKILERVRAPTGAPGDLPGRMTGKEGA